MAEKIKKFFKSFADEPVILDGEKIKIEDILDIEIELLAFKIKPSQYTKTRSGNFATVQFKKSDTEQHQIFFTGSVVLLEQLTKYSEELPFYTIIRKIDKFYTLT